MHEECSTPARSRAQMHACFEGTILNKDAYDLIGKVIISSWIQSMCPTFIIKPCDPIEWVQPWVNSLVAFDEIFKNYIRNMI